MKRPISSAGANSCAWVNQDYVASHSLGTVTVLDRDDRLFGPLVGRATGGDGTRCPSTSLWLSVHVASYMIILTSEFVRLFRLKYRNQAVIHVVGLPASGWQYEKRKCRNTVTLGHRNTDGTEQQRYFQRQNERKIREEESCV